MLTLDDADTDELMRSLIELSSWANLAVAGLPPDYVRLASGGFVLVGDELRFASEANRPSKDQRLSASQSEWEEDDIFIPSDLDYDNPLWRVPVLRTALDVVNKLLPRAALVSTYPVQAIMFLNNPPSRVR